MRKFCTRAASAATTSLALLGYATVSVGGDHHRRQEAVIAAPTTYVATPTTYLAPTSYVATSRVVSSQVLSPTSYSYVIPTSATYAVPTSYVVPTSTTYAVPTSYVVPTSTTYVVPTSTSVVLPTSYVTSAYSVLPTSYAVTPTTYYTTSYRRGLLNRLFARPVIETSRTFAYDVTPTSYYLPTTISLDAPAVATGYSLACNETSIPFVAPSAPANAASADPASKSIRSTPKSEPDPPYNDQVRQNPRTLQPKAAAPAEISPPASPAAEKGTSRPADPADDLKLPPPSEPPNVEEPKSTTAFRPKATELKPREGSAAPNMLRGEIVSGLTGKALSGMQVVFEDPNHVFQNRTRTTDDKGAFEVFLPNGDWTIRVVDPAAPAGTKAKEYGMVTATSGRYLDQDSSPIYGLRISN